MSSTFYDDACIFMCIVGQCEQFFLLCGIYNLDYQYETLTNCLITKHITIKYA